jgi:phosphonatase-like hydrolase
MKNIKLMVFDMAGTTVNEKNVVYKTVQKAIQLHGIDTDLETVLEHGAGKEKFKAIKDVISYLGQEEADVNAIHEDFKSLLEEAYDTLDVAPVDGVEELMLELRSKGIIVVLNTGYKQHVARHLVTKLNWEEGVHYDLLITADDVEKGRPNPDMILLAMEKFNIKDPSVVLKAGDSAIDIVEGTNARCGVTVGVLSGAQNREQIEVAKPTYILDSLIDLKRFF